MYLEHIQTLCGYAEKALKQSALHGEIFDGIVFHSGSEMNYHADDHTIAFHPIPHFSRWFPYAAADQFLLVEPGNKPKLVLYQPQDYWYESPTLPELPYQEAFDVFIAEDLEGIKEGLGFVASCAYVGNNPDLVLDLGIFEPGIEPPYLMAALDWLRGYKTPFEVECLRSAAQKAAAGYAKIADVQANQPSERALLFDYLIATEHQQHEMPYQPIIGWDNAAAILHYQNKSLTNPQLGHTLLVDAGAQHLGYAIDITRTYLPEHPNPIFAALHKKIDDLCQHLCAKCVAGTSYQTLHEEAHQAIAEALCEVGVLKTTPEEAFMNGLTLPFFPHGLGHHLGIQVHDVAGHQLDIKGTEQEPDDRYPSLRTTRPVEAGNVLTIEPGIYFIPMLLAPFKSSHPDVFNWDLIDELTPLGGIRIEDNIFVGETESENLTRHLVPQPIYA